MRSCSLYDTAVAETVGRYCKENILSFVLSAAPSVAMREMKTAEVASLVPTRGAVGKDC